MIFMDPQQFEKVLEVIKVEVNQGTEVAVKKHVNGHIKALTERVDTYIKEDTEWKKDDKEWKDKAQPSVNLGSKVITFTDAMKWILLTGASIAGFILAIQTINGLFK